MGRTPAPSGDLGTFAREAFEHDGMSLHIYRKGSGPAVIVMTEMPGLSPQVLGFADRVVGLGCTAILPDLFGDAGRDPLAGGLVRGLAYYLRTLASVCIRREFNVFVSGRTSPVVALLRRLAVQEHGRCGGPGVGVVGMCFTGGFALAVATEPCVLAPVMSQPALPGFLPGRPAGGIDCDAADLARVAGRCKKEGLQVIGLRFAGDRLVPKERFELLREELGSSFVPIELKQEDGNPRNPLPDHHSVLTVSLIDEPGEPTHAALRQVLDFLQTKLLAS